MSVFFAGCAVPTAFRACIYLFPFRSRGARKQQAKNLATFRLVCSPVFFRDLLPDKGAVKIALDAP